MTLCSLRSPSFCVFSLIGLPFAFCSLGAAAQEVAATGSGSDFSEIEEIIISERKLTYANNATSQVMIEQKAKAASVMSVIDSLPGIFVGEGGPFGSDDWSASLNIRGFSVSLAEQQIGMTIDGLPNGNSDYWGGGKPNRYMDSENLERAVVSQGTADIASPSHEALGGTIDFVTRSPLDEQALEVGLSYGEHNAQRFFGRYDTGMIGDHTRAYVSGSYTHNRPWIKSAGNTNRAHVAVKLETELDAWRLTGRFSWNKAYENNYQRVSLSQFEANPDWDRLSGDFTGIPWVDQTYRPGWATQREHFFAYYKAEYESDTFQFRVTPYYHRKYGRGDWVPPYLVIVEGGDERGGTIFAGSAVARYSYTDAAGTPMAVYRVADGAGPFDLAPGYNAACTETLDFPYGGGSTFDNPACYSADAVPVATFRHTHYGKKRYGVTAEANLEWPTGNKMRAGLWWEDGYRYEVRKWHSRTDAANSLARDETPYWVQYDRSFNTNTLMFYGEDTFEAGRFLFRFGVKKFFVDVTRTDELGNEPLQGINSDSPLLLSTGVLFEMSEAVEVFAGYSENFAAIKDGVIEGRASETNPLIPDLQGERADNYEAGFRFSRAGFDASVTAYFIKFNNRITFVSSGDPVGGIDFLEEGEGSFLNVGGIESKGVEASASADLFDYFNLYVALTINNSKYTTTTADVVEGFEVALAPRFQMVSTFSYRNRGWRAGVSAKHVGARWGNFSNTDRLPDFTLVDLWFGYEMEGSWLGTESIDIGVNISNLLDQRFLGSGTSGSYFIGAGRQATVNITARF